MYDVHGNMVATLARSGSSSYTTGNAVEYDVWGSVRSGSSTVDQKYCANLGHRSDAESSLQYMRARYYDPSTGRFISEDRMKDGRNWFSYAGRQPTCATDPSGSQMTKEEIMYEKLLDIGRYFYELGALFVIGGIAAGFWWSKKAAFILILIGFVFAILGAAVTLYAFEAVNAAIRIGESGQLPPVPALLLLGGAGVFMYALSLGWEPDDADAWVWV